jgi:hypothetical protein
LQKLFRSAQAPQCTAVKRPRKNKATMAGRFIWRGTIVALISGVHAESPNLYFDVGVALGGNKRLILVVDPSAAASLPSDLRERDGWPCRRQKRQLAKWRRRSAHQAR